MIGHIYTLYIHLQERIKDLQTDHLGLVMLDRSLSLLAMLRQRTGLQAMTLLHLSVLTKSNPLSAPIPLPSTRRALHTTPTPMFLRYLMGDTYHEKIHKGIGDMLKEYDANVAKLHGDAVESVTLSPWRSC